MNPPKVLIIEDDLALAKTIKNVLAINGYEPFATSNGSEGIQKAYEINPDLILCDIAMSPIDGYQVFRILSDSFVTCNIPFFFISGKADLDDIRYGMELGIDDYIVKPFTNDELLKSIHVRLLKYEKLLSAGKSDYMALFNLSPNGVFLFRGDTIYEANAAFSSLTGIQTGQLKQLSLRQLVAAESYQAIEIKMQKCSSGALERFNEQIDLITPQRSVDRVRLFITASQKLRGLNFMIGLIQPLGQNTGNTGLNQNKLLSVLRDAQVEGNHGMVKKLLQLSDIDEITSIKLQSQENRVIFSKREQEVLNLSCQGLPIKIIADKLSISDRTVEKHRANLMEKTGSKNIVEVIVFAVKHHLIEL